MKILIFLVGYLSFRCPNVFNRGRQNMGNFQTNSLKYCDLDQCKPNWEPHIRNKIAFSPFVNCTLYLLKKNCMLNELCQLNYNSWRNCWWFLSEIFCNSFLLFQFISQFSVPSNRDYTYTDVVLVACLSQKIFSLNLNIFNLFISD